MASAFALKNDPLPIKATGAVGAASNVFAKQSLMLNGTGATLAGRQLETAGTAAAPTTIDGGTF